MRGLHNGDLLGDWSSSCDKLSDFTTHCGGDVAMVTRLEEGSATQSKSFIRAKTQTQHSRQKVKEIVLSDKSCFIDLLCQRLRMFSTIHVNGVIEIGITDQGNWMRDSAGADVIFVASWPLRLRVFNFSCSLVC